MMPRCVSILHRRYSAATVCCSGTAGLYREENGRLVQVTDSPVISVKQDADGAVSCCFLR